ncbi:OmpA family protein [Castellaniella sp.]|uniref:OmpA family protein n=1 Tax=Castellaniella sp. TaxID=1955812 RepID=UPI002B001B70|nr:OmpA family protein [Castellaniella sp.]
MFTIRTKSSRAFLMVIVALFLTGCVTANRNYHGITLDDAAFNFGSAKLTPAGLALLDEYTTRISKQNNLRIAIVGHSDRIGNETANRALSLKRAEATRDEMVRIGADPASIHVRSVGSSEPLVQCNETNREALIKCLAPNRRVEVFTNLAH